MVYAVFDPSDCGISSKLDGARDSEAVKASHDAFVH